MKKALVSFLITVFLVSASGKLAFAGDGRSNEVAKVGIVAGLLTGLVALAGLVSFGNTKEREETNRLAIVKGNETAQKQINANVTTSALYSGVKSGEIDYGSTSVGSSLKINNIEREPVQVTNAPAPIREQTLPLQQEYRQQTRARCNALPPPHADKCFMDAGVRPW